MVLKMLIRYIKNYSELLIWYFLKLLLPKSETNGNSLLLFNSGRMGDLVVSSIMLENPESFDKFKKVYFLIKNQYLELFEDYNGKVKIIGYNYKKYKYSIIYKYKFLSMLRGVGFNTCINLTAARGILNEEIVHLTNANNIITLNSFWKYLGTFFGKYLDAKYTNIIAENILNEYDKHVELIKYLRNEYSSDIIFNGSHTFDVSQKLSGCDTDEISDSIIIAPFSSTMDRDWKSIFFVKIIKELSIDHKIVLLGSRVQRKRLEDLCEDYSNIKIFPGKLKLNEIPALLSKAKLFVGLDSGITHIALKVGIPLVAIIGGGEFGRFFPYSESKRTNFLYHKTDCFLCHWKCIHRQKFCMTNVTPQDLLAVVNTSLGL